MWKTILYCWKVSIGISDNSKNTERNTTSKLETLKWWTFPLFELSPSPRPEIRLQGHSRDLFIFYSCQCWYVPWIELRPLFCPEVLFYDSLVKEWNRIRIELTGEVSWLTGEVTWIARGFCLDIRCGITDMEVAGAVNAYKWFRTTKRFTSDRGLSWTTWEESHHLVLAYRAPWETFYFSF